MVLGRDEVNFDGEVVPTLFAWQKQRRMKQQLRERGWGGERDLPWRREVDFPRSHHLSTSAEGNDRAFEAGVEIWEMRMTVEGGKPERG